MYKSYLEYNQTTGVFTWLVTMCSTAVKGQQAGSLNNGYRYIQLHGKKVAEHQLAYWWVTGEWILGLDHIDRNKNNNVYTNLRKATRRQQGLNRDIQRNNVSGYKNVSWYKRTAKWKVEFKVHGKMIHVGYFSNIDTAVQQRNIAKGRYI